jgi:hypothetical protein
MASALVNNGKHVALDGLAAVAVFASLHTATPDASGSNEVTGGSPAYVRKAITWAAASGGAKAISNAPVLDVPAGTTVAHVGLWSASSAGTFYGYWDVTDEVFAAQGTYTLTAGSVSL